MKKNIFKFLAATLLVLGVSSCAKEEIGGTAVQDMCGEWYVAIDYVDESGNVLESYGSGYPLYTYNTNANIATEMYIEDGYFYPFRLIVNVDYVNKTFGGSDLEDDYAGQPPMSVIKGSIVKDGTKSDAGYIADSIEFTIVDADGDAYWYHGYRRTGLAGGYD